MLCVRHLFIQWLRNWLLIWSYFFTNFRLKYHARSGSNSTLTGSPQSAYPSFIRGDGKTSNPISGICGRKPSVNENSTLYIFFPVKKSTVSNHYVLTIQMQASKLRSNKVLASGNCSFNLFFFYLLF